MKIYKSKDNQKGITLIALVVTIVVLLILAGISISMLTGESGIISQAKNAKEQNEIGKEKEYINLAFSAVKAGKIARGDTSAVTSEELQEEINNYTREATVTGTGILTITYTSGREYEVDGSGNITIIGESYDGMYSEEGLEGQIAPEDLFEYEIINEKAKTAKIVRIKSEYCNIDGFDASTDFFGLTDTNGEIIYKGQKISDTLVIPYEVIINGTKYKITEANIGVARREYYSTAKFYYMSLPNVKKIIYPNSIENMESYFDSDYSGDITYYLDDTRYSIIENITFSNNIKMLSSDMLKNTLWYDNQPDGDVYVGKAYYEYKGEMPADTSITIREGTTTIIADAFSGCSNLISITIPSSITYIGENAFNWTSWYDNQPDGDVYIGKVYYGYKGEMPENTSIAIKEETTQIASGAFYNYGNLTSITIPDSVRYIEEGAFAYCSNLTSITIPNGVTSIGNAAFSGCSGLTNIVIPNNVASIGDSTFEYCYNLTSITIPDTVTKIETYAFWECTSLTNITIPTSVTSIGASAFGRCSSLTSVTIPNNVTTIVNAAFYGCSSLTNITIPNSVTSIGERAFEGCSSLASIVIPSGVTTIGANAFEGTVWYENQPDGDMYIGNIYYKYKGTMPENTSIVIKEGTTQIASGAFYDCVNLTSVTIPNTVISIGESAFQYCSNLTNITIPDGVKSIECYAFGYCRNLTSITIPNSVKAIRSRAFSGCSNLTNIIIPDSVTSIGNEAFSYCSSLTNIEIPNGVTAIIYYTFEDCTNLTNITIPDSVTSIDFYAFYGCTSLINITIPSSVTSIDNDAFHRCNNLTSINIKKEENSISGAPWNAKNATINWNYTGE